MNNWQPDVKFEEGVFKFDLPNGDEFVIVPPQTKQKHCCPDCGCHFVGEFPFNYAPQTKPCNGFCGEQECKENQDNCGRLQTKPLSIAIEVIKDFQNSDVPPCKYYEDNYADGWMDACNEILWAIEAKVRREK